MKVSILEGQCQPPIDCDGVLSPHAMKYFVRFFVGRIFYGEPVPTSPFKNCGEKNATELFPIRWSAVGQPPAEVVMGKGFGIDSVNMWLKDVGMQVSEEDAMKVLQAVKLHSLTNKKMLSHAEFRDVARATLGRSQQAAE